MFLACSGAHQVQIRRRGRRGVTEHSGFSVHGLVLQEVSETEAKTTHVINMGTAGKSGVMGQKNVKCHRSFLSNRLKHPIRLLHPSFLDLY